MRDITSALADIIGRFAGEANGERDMLAIACALENAAKAVRAEREGMTTVASYHCCDCGKAWGVRVTVAREREMWTPENCPRCYNASTPKTVDVHSEVLVPRTDGGVVEGRVEEIAPHFADADPLVKVSWFAGEANGGEKQVGKWIERSKLTPKPRRSGWTDEFFYLPEED
jgi:hypothetical protein